jgi:hypothetical protein
MAKQYIAKFIFALVAILWSNHLFAQKRPLKDTLFWKTDSTLKWSDFKGHAQSNMQMAAESYIVIQTKGEPNVNTNAVDILVRPIFQPKKSWYKSPKDTTKYLLEHEELHFDIAELNCRMMRKELKAEFKSSFTDYVKRFEKILNKYEKQYVKMSEDYDKETSHSLNMEKQKEWNDRIKKQLNDFQDYSSATVSIDLGKYK